MHIRPLTTFDDCLAAAALERLVWGFSDGEDVIPAAVLIASIKRGAILLGGWDAAGRLLGVVYSVPAIRAGTLTQWSHLLGVLPEARDSGLGSRLKLAQRTAALEQGLDLVEWTFDPLQALNAHFNCSRLGVIVEEYEENAYGASSSPLHAGTPTDRFVAEWHIARPHVERRLAAWGQPVVRDHAVGGAPLVNAPVRQRDWLAPGPADLAIDARRLLVEIPTGFGEMQIADSPLAMAWRMHTREIFQTYLGRGYRVVDFFLARAAGRGQYLLVTDRP